MLENCAEYFGRSTQLIKKSKILVKIEAPVNIDQFIEKLVNSNKFDTLLKLHSTSIK